MKKEEAKEIIKRFENYSKSGTIYTTRMVREVEKARDCVKDNNSEG